jgi:hypothetical protein
MNASNVFCGNWGNVEEMLKDFDVSADAVKDATILFAQYDYIDYEGFAFVLFKRDGFLYEVNGSHCSCYGLEGQWDPEETFPEALLKRSFYGMSNADKLRLDELVKSL